MNKHSQALWKKTAEAIFKEAKVKELMPKQDFPQSWSFTESEWQDVENVITLIDKDKFSLTEIKEQLDSFFIIDCQTLRLISEGCIVHDGDHQIAFGSDEHALAYINTKGHNFKHWHEAQEAADMMEIEWCYQWSNSFDVKAMMQQRTEVKNLVKIAIEIPRDK